MDTEVDTFVAKQIFDYPSLFGCRTEVLLFAFFQGGNGMWWADGGLFSSGRERVFRYQSEKANIAKVKETDERLGMREIYGDRHEEYLEEQVRNARLETRKTNQILKFRRDNALDLAKTSWRNKIFDYRIGDIDLDVLGITMRPLCYPYYGGPATHVPDDIKPAWLQALRETLLVIFDAPMENIHEKNEKMIAEIQTRQKANLQYASNILTELAFRFGREENQPINYEEYLMLKQRRHKKISESMAEFFGIEKTKRKGLV